MNYTEQPFYLITGQPYTDIPKFLAILETSLNSGIKLVQIRAKTLNKNEFKTLAIEAIKLCHEYDAKVLLNGNLEFLEETRADGIHYPSADLMRIEKRPFSAKYLFSCSCHNVEQVTHASKVGADFIIISPIFSTPSSPAGNPLGWENFKMLATISNVPVYALGGLTPEHLEIARTHGATGIAAIRAFWR